MLGNEGQGMTDKQMALCDSFVYIPQVCCKGDQSVYEYVLKVCVHGQVDKQQYKSPAITFFSRHSF